MAEETESKSVINMNNRAPNWMVTYADLMSLLFCLFVLLLSFSEVNDNSFKKNAGPMRVAFNQNADFQTDELSHRTGGRGILQGVKTVPLNVPEPGNLREAAREQLRQSLRLDLASNLVEMEDTSFGVIVRFPSNTTFQPGGAELAPESFPILDKIIKVMARTPGDIKVGGHTDDVPISTLQFRSNWDLSAARAISVIHYFIQSGQIGKERLISQGYADSRPLMPNRNEASRAKNRRVELAIEIPEDSKEYQKLLERTRPQQRIWTIREGETELQEGADFITGEQRREEARQRAEKLKRENDAKGNALRDGLMSIGRDANDLPPPPSENSGQ